jgi:hypothetical protein
MKYRKSKAHERHKRAVQQAYDFAVTMCYAVPHLATHLTAVEAGRELLQAPQYFAPNNTTQYLRTNIATFEQRLSSYMLLSLFSFFESFVHDIVQEMFDFHGGPEKLLALATKRDQVLAAAAQTPTILTAKAKLRKNVKAKHEKYKKYSKVLLTTGYRFPSERLSSYGVRMLIERHKNLKAHAIPDLLAHGLSVPFTNAEKAHYDLIRDKRNRIAHGRPEQIDLAYIRTVNDFFRDMTFRINTHLLDHYFVVEEYAY